MKKFMKNNAVSLILLLIALILVVGFSYSWLRLTKTASQVNKIQAGSLEMILDDNASEGILLLNQVPKSYAQGMKTVEYTFKLTNNGDTVNDYTIYLNDIANYQGKKGNIIIQQEEKLSDDLLRFNLLKNDEIATPSKSKLLSSVDSRAIDVGQIAPQETITYSFRIWIDSKAGDGITQADVMGKKFNAGLTVEVGQSIN